MVDSTHSPFLRSKTFKSILTFVLFQVGWWSCLWFGVNRFSVLSLPLAIIIFAITTWIWSYKLKQTLRCLAFIVVGAAVDAILLMTNVIEARNEWPPWPLPTWLLGMWILFVVTVPALYSSWARLPWYYLSPIGAVGGALSYAAGLKFDLLLFHEPKWQSVGILAICWSVYFPICVQKLSLPESMQKH